MATSLTNRKSKKYSIICNLQELLNKITSSENTEDAVTVCNELMDLSSSSQWHNYKNSILSELIEMYRSERKYLLENNELQNNCLSLYKNCQALQERLDEGFKKNLNNVDGNDKWMKPDNRQEYKFLRSSLLKQKASLLDDMEALAEDKEEYIRRECTEFAMENNDLANSAIDLVNELKAYENLVELKEHSFEKLKDSFLLNMDNMELDVNRIHNLSMEYHEIVKQRGAEIVQLKQRVYELREQIKVLRTSQETRNDLMCHKLYNVRDAYEETHLNKDEDIYDLLKNFQLYINKIVQLSEPFSNSMNKSDDHLNYNIKEHHSLRKDVSIQTEDFSNAEIEYCNGHRKKENFEKLKSSDLNCKLKELHLFKNATTDLKQSDWDDMMRRLKIAKQTEEDLKQELELKTMELETLNRVFNEQNDHLQKLEQFSVSLELRKQEDIQNIKKSYEMEINVVKEELDYCRYQMDQQAQFIVMLQKAQKVGYTNDKYEVNELNRSQEYTNKSTGIQVKKRVEYLEKRRENRKHFKSLQHIKSNSITDDHLNSLNEMTKTEHEYKRDCNIQELKRQRNAHTYRYYSDNPEKYLDLNNGLRDAYRESAWFEMDTDTKTSNLIDDYKKWLQGDNQTC